MEEDLFIPCLVEDVKFTLECVRMILNGLATPGVLFVCDPRRPILVEKGFPYDRFPGHNLSDYSPLFLHLSPEGYDAENQGGNHAYTCWAGLAIWIPWFSPNIRAVLL